jgi:hypothetical protein
LQRSSAGSGKRQMPPLVPVPVTPLMVPAVPTLVPIASAGVGNPQGFAHELPYYPSGQPFLMFKSRCTHFLNDALERASYNPQLTLHYLPKCRWSQVECATLEADLMARFSAPALGAGVAPAPGPSPPAVPGATGTAVLLGSSAPCDTQPPGNNLYGWCDTLYTMAKTRAIHGLGATPTKVPPQAVPFDCKAGFLFWVKAWCPEKKTWCCQNEGLGCPARQAWTMYQAAPR